MKKFVLIGCLLLSTAPVVVRGQGCTVCTQTADGLDDKSAKGLNGGIVYLAFLPLVIMGTLGFIWWRHNKGQ
jgi:hypothetical protein